MLPFRAPMFSLPLFTLDANHRPVPCEFEKDWRAWMQTPARWVEDALLDAVAVTTAFLGVEHNSTEDGQPGTLFETVVRVVGETRYLCRYVTWDEAVAGHADIAGRIQGVMPQGQIDVATAWAQVTQRDGLMF